MFFTGRPHQEELLRGRVKGRRRSRQGHRRRGQGQRPEERHDELLSIYGDPQETRREVVRKTGGVGHQVTILQNCKCSEMNGRRLF